VANKVFGVLDTQPRHTGFTLNSDTPYGVMLLDLSNGPLFIDILPGPLIILVMDIHQRWVADIHLSDRPMPGFADGSNGRHLILPPGFVGEVPQNEPYYVYRATSNKIIVGVRSIPKEGNVEEAFERITNIRVYPYNEDKNWIATTWIDMSDKPQDTTLLQWENNIKFWEVLHEVINDEPAFDNYSAFYGELAALGLVKGIPFTPDERMVRILEKAATIANAQMRVQAFSDRRPDRVVWQDRQWEWIGLRPESGDFETAYYVDQDARETWFYQAIGASSAMFSRQPGSGSVYWLGTKDVTGAYLDGGKTYRLQIPQPVPAELFWSVTVYDVETRSQINTLQGKASIRSLFELHGMGGYDVIDLYFGPEELVGQESTFIKTIPGKGWFAYFRIYGPGEAAFDGTWMPGDFVELIR
jgi:hypothetical protein